jgi:hypothetical protein
MDSFAPKGAMECGREAAAFFFSLLKAAASQPHSMGFAVNYIA